jgi:predicted outer membrane repeat protein
MRAPRILRRDAGISLTGYALLLGLIAVLALSAISLFGGSVRNVFTLVGDDLSFLNAGNGGNGGGGNEGDDEEETPDDTLPDTFDFMDEDDAALSGAVSSDIRQITGIDVAVDISVAGDGSPEYRLCADATCSAAPGFTSVAGSASAGDYVQLRLTSSGSNAVPFTAVLSVGDLDVDWTATTLSGPPPPFAAVDDAVSTAKGVAVTINVLANDTGLTDPPITVSVTAQGGHGNAAVNPGNTVTYTPALSTYAGTDEFTYQVQNGLSEIRTAVVRVTMADITITTLDDEICETCLGTPNLAAELGDGTGLSLREAIGLTDLATDAIGFAPAVAGGVVHLNPAFGPINMDRGDVLLLVGDGTIVDGGDVMRIMEFGAFNDVTLHDIVLRNGNSGSETGGALRITGGSTVRLFESRLEGNHSDVGGGAVQAATGTLEVTDTDFIENSAGQDGGAIESSRPLHVNGGSFEGNSSGAAGGAISASAETIISGADFIGNAAVTSGGAITMGSGSGATSTIDGCTFTGNSVPGGIGGAIYFPFPTAKTLSNSVLTQNSAADGGAVRAVSAVTIQNTTIDNNTATGQGGGIYSQSNGVGTIQIVSSTISNNTSSNQGGGISYAVGTGAGSLFALSNSTVYGNISTSAQGGGVYVTGGTPTVRMNNVTITSNSAATQGGGFYANRDASINNVIATGNSASGGGTPGVDLFINTSRTLSGTNNLVAGGVAAIGGSGTKSLSATAATAAATFGGSTLADNGGPTGTVAIANGGPAVNAGSNGQALSSDGSTSLSFDQRGSGHARILGGTVDIGAYEAQ